MDAIERIEVSLRTSWAYTLSHSYGPHAHLQKKIEMLKKTVKQSAEVFTRHFRKYDERLPPVWVNCEIMTIGQLSKWYANLKHGYDRTAILNE